MTSGHSYGVPTDIARVPIIATFSCYIEASDVNGDGRPRIRTMACIRSFGHGILAYVLATQNIGRIKVFLRSIGALTAEARTLKLCYSVGSLLKV